jgi:hypothetical protein
MTKAIEVKVTKFGAVTREGTLVELTQGDMIEAHNELVSSYMELRDEFIKLQKEYNALLLSMIVPEEAIQ